jgi:hypothetical protein
MAQKLMIWLQSSGELRKTYGFSVKLLSINTQLISVAYTRQQTANVCCRVPSEGKVRQN